MLKVGEIYILSETWIGLPKGMKVKLIALLEAPFKSWNGDTVYSAIIESAKGSPFKYYKGEDPIVSRSNELTEDTPITFLPERYLSELNEEDKNRIIIWNLATKWNVYQADSYNKMRSDHMKKYGYDIHKLVYK